MYWCNKVGFVELFTHCEDNYFYGLKYSEEVNEKPGSASNFWSSSLKYQDRPSKGNARICNKLIQPSSEWSTSLPGPGLRYVVQWPKF